jgi:hypothetical protein
VGRPGISEVAIRHRIANGVFAGLVQRSAGTGEWEGAYRYFVTYSVATRPVQREGAGSAATAYGWRWTGLWSIARRCLRKGVPHEEWPDPIR